MCRIPVSVVLMESISVGKVEFLYSQVSEILIPMRGEMVPKRSSKNRSATGSYFDNDQSQVGLIYMWST